MKKIFILLVVLFVACDYVPTPTQINPYPVPITRMLDSSYPVPPSIPTSEPLDPIPPTVVYFQRVPLGTDKIIFRWVLPTTGYQNATGSWTAKFYYFMPFHTEIHTGAFTYDSSGTVHGYPVAYYIYYLASNENAAPFLITEAFIIDPISQSHVNATNLPFWYSGPSGGVLQLPLIFR